MSNPNRSSALSTRQSTQLAAVQVLEAHKTVRFTLDNEEVHEVSFTWENKGPMRKRARVCVPGDLKSFAHSPSDHHEKPLPHSSGPPAWPKSADRPDERLFLSSQSANDLPNGISMPSHLESDVSSRQQKDRGDLVALWHSLLSRLAWKITENYDVPVNLQSRHLRVFVPGHDQDQAPPDSQPEYQELVCFDLKGHKKGEATTLTSS